MHTCHAIAPCSCAVHMCMANLYIEPHNITAILAWHSQTPNPKIYIFKALRKSFRRKFYLFRKQINIWYTMKRPKKLTIEEIQAYQKIFFEYSKKPFGRDEFILDYYERIRATDLAEICCCSPRLVQHITLNHGIKRRTGTKNWSSEEELSLINDYISLSKEDLENKYKCKYSAISAKVEKLKNGKRKAIYIVGEGIKHHINGDTSDNKEENLYVFETLGEHKTCHRTLNMCLWKLIPVILKEEKIKFVDGKYYIP